MVTPPSQSGFIAFTVLPLFLRTLTTDSAVRWLTLSVKPCSQKSKITKISLSSDYNSKFSNQLTGIYIRFSNFILAVIFEPEDCQRFLTAHFDGSDKENELGGYSRVAEEYLCLLYCYYVTSNYN